MTALAEHLRRLIAIDGPIPLSRYMAEALGHPEHGYYMCQDPLGVAGDFITAPEISQMFGELMGLWCAETWRQMGAPQHVLLVELGPGRGTLMSDMLRAVRVLPDFAAATEVHLVETSRALRRRQQDRLATFDVRWHDSLTTVPAGPILLVANEFFDALPVRQFERNSDGWHERLVASDGDRFRLVLAPAAAPSALIPAILVDADVGSIVEIGPAREAIMRDVAERLATDGGAALIVDYGHENHATGDTLQAVKGHEYHDALMAPGAADLTAHVDFEALAAAARHAGAKTHGPVPQGRFLAALGIDRRTDALASAAPERATEIQCAHDRLVLPEQMGALFKVLGIAHPKLGTPAGLEAIT